MSALDQPWLKNGRVLRQEVTQDATIVTRDIQHSAPHYFALLALPLL